MTVLRLRGPGVTVFGLGRLNMKLLGLRLAVALFGLRMAVVGLRGLSMTVLGARRLDMALFGLHRLGMTLFGLRGLGLALFGLGWLPRFGRNMAQREHHKHCETDRSDTAEAERPTSSSRQGRLRGWQAQFLLD